MTEDAYSAVLLERGQFLTNIKKNTPYSSPVRANYGLSFVDPASNWYSAPVPVITYGISYNIGPRYNGIRMNIFF